jgi:Holliday junction resolvase
MGSKFENWIVNYFGSKGYWASAFPKANDGSQPADVIALNSKRKCLIDAKVCSTGRFVLSRMEENQLHSMEMFTEKCGGNGYFALEFPEGKYLVSVKKLLRIQSEGKKSVTPSDLYEWEKLDED